MSIVFACVLLSLLTSPSTFIHVFSLSLNVREERYVYRDFSVHYGYHAQKSSSVLICFSLLSLTYHLRREERYVWDICVHYDYHAQVLIIHIIFYSITQTEPRAHPRKGSTKRVKMKRLLRQINQSLRRWKEGTMWESIHIQHQGSNPLEWSVFSLSLSRCGQIGELWIAVRSI